jgi:hypothetical protein
MKRSSCIQSCLFALILGIGAFAFAGDACGPEMNGKPAVVPGVTAAPRTTFTASVIQEFVAYLRGGYRFIGEVQDGGYWDEYARLVFRNGGGRLDRSRDNDKKNPKRRWFFPYNDLGRETREFIDLEALGLGRDSNMATSERVENLLIGPYVDAVEIRERQGAMQDLVQDKSGIRTGINKNLSGENSRRVLRRMFDAEDRDSNRLLKPNPSDVSTFIRAKRCWDEHPEVLQGKDAPGDMFYEMAEKTAVRNNIFFRDSLAVVKTLRDSKPKSLRLQKLLWVLDSIIADPSAGKWLSESSSTADVVKHYELQMQLAQEGQEVKRAGDYRTIPARLPGRISLYLEAYSELIMYFELAEYAIAREWLTFPTVLDQSPSIGPVFAITNGHAPRWKEAYRDPTKTPDKESVPNSIELGSNGFRHLIITGPNYQGKSTALRMMSQLLVLAQIGMPVPADAMTLTPMNLVIYMHPKDDGKNSESLYSAEIQELWGQIHRQAVKDPFQIFVLDEIAPGTRQEVREATEETVLRFMDRARVLTVEATHNTATTNLASEPNSTFTNMHVANFRLLPGFNNDLAPMFSGALAVQQRAGVPPEAMQMFQQLADQKIREQKEKLKQK